MTIRFMPSDLTDLSIAWMMRRISRLFLKSSITRNTRTTRSAAAAAALGMTLSGMKQATTTMMLKMFHPSRR